MPAAGSEKLVMWVLGIFGSVGVSLALMWLRSINSHLAQIERSILDLVEFRGATLVDLRSHAHRIDRIEERMNRGAG